MTDIQPGTVESISEQVVPYEDGKKSTYLSYRVAGFTVTEAVKLAKVHHKSVMRWRVDDLQFRHLDTEGMTEFRKKLSNHYLDIEFTRNFRLVLQKDFEILYKSVTGVVLAEQDQEYLLKLRNHYTPQHLAMIKQLLGGGSVSEPFDFTKLTLTIRRERETMEIRTEGG